jgi:hypothetical protein
MASTAIRHVSMCLLASAAISGCATDDNQPEDLSMSEAALSSNEQTAFNFFVTKGLTKIQAAGVMAT